MAEYYISVKKFFPVDSDPVYVGPYPRRPHAEEDLNNFKRNGKLEIVKKDEVPHDVTKAIIVDILTKTQASRSGMSEKKNNILGERISDDMAEKLGIDVRKNGNGNNMKERVIEYEYDSFDDEIEPYHYDDGDEYEILTEAEKADALIVSKFPSNVEWLNQHGIYGKQVFRAREHDVEGKTVVGTIPYRLGLLAKRVGFIDMPKIRADQIGRTLNTDDLYDAGAELRWVRVVEEKGEWAEFFRFISADPGNWKKIMKLIRNSS